VCHADTGAIAARWSLSVLVGFLDVALTAARVLCMLIIGVETQGVSLEAID
jgi:hypothetical protein